VAAVALLLPHRLPLLLGPVVSGPLGGVAGLSGLAYPSDGSVVSGRAVSLDVRACASRGSTYARAQLRAVSLFGGAIRANLVGLSVGKSDSVEAAALSVNGKRVPSVAGTRVPLGWGYVVVGPADLLPVFGGGLARSALAVHLVHPHGGLAAGSELLVSVVGVPRIRQAAHRKRRASHEPLKVTPPLGLPHYIFPVVGASEYIDTYGAFRSDVPGKWHHGDDIFAPLGTPVVAVASGTINRVGWEKIGGWRVWVRDDVGDEFYYAHLSGYVPGDLTSNRVRAGQVIGFVGNTGDAFTTSPHLHFEVHPRQLLHLGYDGAVDPTRYLDQWTHLTHVHVPVPAHPPLPRAPLLRREARYVFRELLAARHLIRHAPNPSDRPKIEIPAGANGPPVAVTPVQAAAALPGARHRGGTGPAIELLAALAMVSAAAVLLIPVVRRRRRREPVQQHENHEEDA